MSRYALRDKLPSCKVTKSLLQELEIYVQAHAEQVFDFDKENLEKNYSVTVQEGLGEEYFVSAKDIKTSKFSDSTKSVELRLVAYNPYLKIKISFSAERYLSWLEIESESVNARESVIGFREGILRILEGQKDYNWIFNPSPQIQGALSVLLPAGLAISPWILLSDLSTAIRVSLIVVVLSLLTYMIGSYLNSYTSFDSRKADSKEKVWRWWLSGMVTFLIFGVLLTTGYQAIVGQ